MGVHVWEGSDIKKNDRPGGIEREGMRGRGCPLSWKC